MSEHSATDAPSAEPASDPLRRYRTLPAPVRLEDTFESFDPLPPPDPTMGRDPDQDFLLRNAG